jgi:hypothetical protein
MKFSLSLSLVGFCLLSCNSIQTTVAPESALPSVPHHLLRATPQPEADLNVLSRDYAVAEIAINNAVLTGNKATLKLGLESPIITIKQKAVEAIPETTDEDFVPSLIAALQSNQGLMAGGTEIQILQNNLNVSVIVAIATLTKMKFKVSEHPTSAEVSEVILRSQEWCKKRAAKSSD